MALDQNGQWEEAQQNDFALVGGKIVVCGFALALALALCFALLFLPLPCILPSYLSSYKLSETAALACSFSGTTSKKT